MSASTSYLLGTCFIGIGAYAFLQPIRAYHIFGLPPPLPSMPETALQAKLGRARAGQAGHPYEETSSSSSSSPAAAGGGGGVAENEVSPFLYAKAGRDIAIGALFVALQYQGDDRGVGTLMAVCCFLNVVDGWVVWTRGLRSKAWSHGVALVPLVVFAWKRLGIAEGRGV